MWNIDASGLFTCEMAVQIPDILQNTEDILSGWPAFEKITALPLSKL